MKQLQDKDLVEEIMLLKSLMEEKNRKMEEKIMGVGYLIALSLFTAGVVIIALCILLNNI